jgi:2-keto-4-pentenoate hydratase/2-oxohepta-3-ene-1,7-dioic acid hydratase in catechol pathway
LRIVVFGPEKRVGSWEGDEVVDLHRARAKFLHEKQGESQPYDMSAALVPPDLRGFIGGGARALDHAQQALDYLASAGDRSGARGEQITFAYGSVKIHPPIPNPGSPIACMGTNYMAHGAANRGRAGDPRSDAEVLAELRGERLTMGGDVTPGHRPVGAFWKLTGTIAGHEGDVIYPSRTERLDYEGEVAIVLGKPAKHVSAERVADYIWGVTTHVDWSIRDGDDTGNRTFRHAKNFDTSSSLGPSIVVGELDPQNVDMEVRVNGQLRQQYNSRGMTFSFAEIVEYMSGMFTLEPGFIVSGGCGPGTAMESGKQGDFLQPGHVVECVNPRVGLLRNRIVTEEG